LKLTAGFLLVWSEHFIRGTRPERRWYVGERFNLYIVQKLFTAKVAKKGREDR